MSSFRPGAGDEGGARSGRGATCLRSSRRPWDRSEGAVRLARARGAGLREKATDERGLARLSNAQQEHHGELMEMGVPGQGEID